MKSTLIEVNKLTVYLNFTLPNFISSLTYDKVEVEILDGMFKN